MKVVFLTAGAAGMYCGSCMHDNSLARAMRGLGVDCLLQPTYTPIRTDEISIADEHLFFGGIQIYLLQKMPFLRFVPSPIRRLLDWAPLLRLASRRAGATDAAMLGDLAISMLSGTHGNQRDEVDRLVDWLVNDIRPDAIVLSNLLIGGLLPAVRERLPETRIAVMLQGDDIFLDHLPERQRAQAIRLCNELQTHVGVFVTNSRFYAEKMGALLGIEASRIEIVPLSIDVSPFVAASGVAASGVAVSGVAASGVAVSGGPIVSPTPSTPAPSAFRLGYLARIAPEKGLHRLVDAFIQMAQETRNSDLRLDVAGWLGETNRAYLQSLTERIAKAGLGDRFAYHGSPNLVQKIEFLRSLDLFCVPTQYEDPKGLFVLESLAAGVCVAQPNHGAFGELIDQTGGGLTFAPDSIDEMCSVLQRLKDQPELRSELAKSGFERVLSNHTIEKAAAILKSHLERNSS